MLWVHDEFAHHGLYYAYISIERAAEKAAKECYPKIHGEADNKKGGNGTETAHKQNGLTS